MNIRSQKQYEEAYSLSLSDPDTYWSQVAKEFTWVKPHQKVLTGQFGDRVEWFSGGELNITVNALDRHVQTHPEKIAIYFEPNQESGEKTQYSYSQLLEKVCQFANVLKAQGIKKGDVVVFYMSMVPELLIGTLACARIGAIHSIVFGGFSSQSLANRIQDSQAKLLVTNNEAVRGDKVIGLKTIADEALDSAPSVKSVLVLKRTGGKINWREGRDHWLEPLMEKAEKICAPETMASEDPLFILYTSGSTGKPKGLLHTTAGYMVWAAETFKHVFQMQKPEDIFWCTADLGWITGHTYIAYGPLLNGVSQVIFEGIPTWPDAGRFWQVIEKFKVSHFYTAPTAIRSLQSQGLSYVQKSNLESLKVLGSVGEPINEEAWQWYNENIGRGECPIVDTWWQTETGGIMISTLAGVTPSVPTMATLPLPGVEPLLVDSAGREIHETVAEGALCMKRPWPGMARTIYGDHRRYQETYFSTYKGYYFSGDGARRDERGFYRISGRIDDVVKVSGHLIGTAEVEDAINLHPLIVESAAIGVPHPIKGQGLVAFATPNSGQIPKPDLLRELNEIITKNIGPLAKLERVIVVSGLPKTRSGKIMRRILRKAFEGDVDQLGDTSTLLNPEVVDEILLKCSAIELK
ncbi:MAG: acetate--CoA ligase [Bdellovibrionales bacterium]|nr:acetate--CoA ligase [Bdellovibrionales bacterium]